MSVNNITLPVSQWVKVEWLFTKETEWAFNHTDTSAAFSEGQQSPSFPFAVPLQWTEWGCSAKPVPTNTSAFNLRQAHISR